MDKIDVKQYAMLQEEINHLKTDIAETEEQLYKLQEEGTVKDKVYGGDGGNQGFVIEGFPDALYSKKVRQLAKKRQKLIEKETLLIDKQLEIEDFLDSIKDPRDRMIFRYTVFNGMTQEEVGKKVYCDRSTVSKIISKYL